MLPPQRAWVIPEINTMHTHTQKTPIQTAILHNIHGYQNKRGGGGCHTKINIHGITHITSGQFMKVDNHHTCYHIHVYIYNLYIIHVTIFFSLVHTFVKLNTSIQLEKILNATIKYFFCLKFKNI